MLIYTGSATAPRGAHSLSLRPRETDLPAQRAPAEASARVPRAHGDARRPRDSQAPPRQGPEASLRVSDAVDAAPASPVSVSGLRRRLPAGALDLDAFSRPVLVR